MRKICAYVLCLLCCKLYGEDIWDLSGKWIPETLISGKPEIITAYDYEGMPPFYYGYRIEGYEKGTSDNIGEILFVQQGLIVDCLVIKSISYEDSKYVLNCFDKKLGNELTLYASFLDSERIKIDGLGKKDMFNGVNVLYRSVSNPLVRKQRAVINTSMVEMKSLPSSKGKTIAFLENGLSCYIVNRYKNPDNGVKNQGWVKVNPRYCAEGWVLDKYVDACESEYYDDKYVKIKSSTFKSGDYYYCLDKSKVYYASNLTLSVDEINEYLRPCLMSKSIMPGEAELLSELNKCNDRVLFTRIDINGFICKRDEFFTKLLQSVSESSFTPSERNRSIATFEKDGAYLLYGVSVGMKQSDLLRILGKPNAEKKSLYIYKSKTEDSKEIEFSFYFTNDTCTKITVSK